jgi:CRISPR-associated endonuclease Cas1
MLDSQPLDATAADWSERCEHWRNKPVPTARPRRRRERETAPLILTGHGVSLKVDKGSLLVRNGFTHHPQRPETRRFFPGDLETPQRIIMIDGSGQLTFDALNWLSEQGVHLVRLNWCGEVVCVLAANGYAADPAKLEWQKRTREDEAARLEFAGGLIRRKLLAALETMEAIIPASPARDVAVTRAEESIARIDGGAVSEVAQLRGLEGPCANAYFSAWAGLAMNWKSETRHPVPPQWREYRQRSTLLSGVKGKNRKADHPINAMLNYAYAMLESEVRINAAAEGYDPMVGIYHHAAKGSPAYVFDLMEPERPRIDRAVLKFALSEKFTAADFILRQDGVCRLGPQLAGMVCKAVTV